MSTNKTENLSLHSWEGTDRVRMEEFNENFSAIDAKAGEVDDAILATTAAVEAVAATLPKIAFGYYTGSGRIGSASPNTLTFDFTPKVLMLFNANYNQNDICSATLCWGHTPNFFINASYPCTASYDGNTVSWYAAGSYATYQLNSAACKYYYFAIG